MVRYGSFISCSVHLVALGAAWLPLGVLQTAVCTAQCAVCSMHFALCTLQPRCLALLSLSRPLRAFLKSELDRVDSFRRHLPRQTSEIKSPPFCRFSSSSEKSLESNLDQLATTNSFGATLAAYLCTSLHFSAYLFTLCTLHPRLVSNQHV